RRGCPVVHHPALALRQVVQLNARELVRLAFAVALTQHRVLVGLVPARFAGSRYPAALARHHADELRASLVVGCIATIVDGASRPVLEMQLYAQLVRWPRSEWSKVGISTLRDVLGAVGSSAAIGVIHEDSRVPAGNLLPDPHCAELV